jgi:hypothetical protein
LRKRAERAFALLVVHLGRWGHTLTAKLGAHTLSCPREKHRASRLMSSTAVTDVAAHECVSPEALAHLKTYKYSSVDKSYISNYILRHYVRVFLPPLYIYPYTRVEEVGVTVAGS